MPNSAVAVFPGQGASRSNSLASTVSSSGASLSRRSRIRKKTRAATADATGPTTATTPLTGTAARGEDALPDFEDTVLDISASFSLELSTASVDGLSEGALADASASVTNDGDAAAVADPDTSIGTRGTFGPGGKDEVVVPGIPLEVEKKTETPSIPPLNHPKGKARHSNLPRLTSPPSSFRPTPAEGDATRSSLRDSLLTQQSWTSSSIYPLSTSTGTESPPSPISPVEQEHRLMPVLAFDPDSHGPKVQEFDADDVSYRLRLLMKNSYFLPPAHSKPLPSDFPSIIHPTRKTPTPTFLDLFRMGKAKSKPASPELASPIVRLTSDTTAASRDHGQGHGHAHGRPSLQIHRTLPDRPRMPRVVVVRETVDNLVAAAKQAEVDLGTHELLADRARWARRRRPEVFDGIIDPTEAVDIPLPSANYPLALQASALHGMGIEESVGAAVLAERLPPPGSPGLSTLDPREDAWRKALLHEAVGHSLSNSAASLSPCHSTPSRTPCHPRSSESLNRIHGRAHGSSAIQQQRRMLDQKILSHPIIDSSDEVPSSPTPAVPANPTGPAATLTTPDIHRLSNYAPLRAETPVPHMPLAPPPRRTLGNPQYSRSQTELSCTKQRGGMGQQPKKSLRRSISSPMLSDTYDVRTPTKSPPPLPSLSVSPVPSSLHRISRMTHVSRYTSSEQGDVGAVAPDEPRPSLAFSLQSLDPDGCPSASEYSQASPTASAFRDRWSEGYYSASSQLQLQQGDAPPQSHHQHEQQHVRESLVPSSPTHVGRFTTMSPPPRPSSSIAGVALSPAPRRGYLPFHSTPTRVVSSRSSSELSRSTFRSFASMSAPASSTGAQQQQHQTLQLPSSLSGNVSVPSFHSALHSALPPSSTVEFFDHIQTHPNAMDDLYDSESASEVDHDHGHDPEQDQDHEDITAVYAPADHQCVTRLNKSSIPDIIYGATVPYYPTGVGVVGNDRRRGVGHAPLPASYFTQLKGSPHTLTQLSLAQRSRDHVCGEGGDDGKGESDDHDGEGDGGSDGRERSGVVMPGGEQVRRWQEVAYEASSKRLDGMVMLHMQAERDTMRRIAQTVKVPHS